MTRRKFLASVKNVLVFLIGGEILSGCGLLIEGKKNVSQLAALLAYLLYEDDPPTKEVSTIEKNLKSILQNSLLKRLKLQWLHLRISFKTERPFEALSPENKKRYFEKILPDLVNSSEVLEFLKQYLKDITVLEYLDYPELPGEYSECGWLIIEGSAWDRYYPPSG
jgi:hypothetical protein